MGGAAVDGRGAENFPYYLHCCTGKGNREGNETRTDGHR
nr:MAG TPA: Gurmarin, sweet, taste, knottin, GPCR.45A [Caudoviricetes sp.]